MELRATFPVLHPLRSVTPVEEHYTRSKRVQCSLKGCTSPSTTSFIADALPRQNGHHD